MEPFRLRDKANALKNAVALGKEHGKRNLNVEVDLLDEILRGNVPVGGNQYPPEDVNAKLHELLDRISPRPGLCEHGVKEGDWCEPCNRAMKQAVIDSEVP